LLAAEVSRTLELEKKSTSNTSAVEERAARERKDRTPLGLQQQDIELAIASKAPSKFAVAVPGMKVAILVILNSIRRENV